MTQDRTKGIMLALVTALISGISVFINGIGVQTTDPIAYTALKNIGVLVFLGAVVFGLNELKHFKGLNQKQWLMLVLIGIIGGSIPFMMFFWGLKMEGAPVSSFIYRSLFIFAGVFGYFILKEKVETRDLFAGAAILVGNALLLPNQLSFGFGQMLVLGASVLWALEYSVSRKVMTQMQVHPRVVMISRMLFGSIVLLGYFVLSGDMVAFIPSVVALPWLLVSSLFLFAFVTTWYYALRNLPILKATGMLAFGGIVTASLNLVILGKGVPVIQTAGICLAAIGALTMFDLIEIRDAMRNLSRMISSLIE